MQQQQATKETQCETVQIHFQLQWIIDLYSVRFFLHFFFVWKIIQLNMTAIRSFNLSITKSTWHEHCRKQLKIIKKQTCTISQLRSICTKYTFWSIGQRNNEMEKKKKKFQLCDRKESEIDHDLHVYIHMIWNKTNGPWHNSQWRDALTVKKNGVQLWFTYTKYKGEARKKTNAKRQDKEKEEKKKMWTRPKTLAWKEELNRKKGLKWNPREKHAIQCNRKTRDQITHSHTNSLIAWHNEESNKVPIVENAVCVSFLLFASSLILRKKTKWIWGNERKSVRWCCFIFMLRRYFIDVMW